MITKAEHEAMEAHYKLTDQVFDRVDAQQWVESEGAENIKKQFLVQREEIAALKAKIEVSKRLLNVALFKIESACAAKPFVESALRELNSQ